MLDRPSAEEDARDRIRRPAGNLVTRRDLPSDFEEEDEDTAAFLRSTGRARRMRPSYLTRVLLRTRTGRIVSGVLAVAVLAGTGLAIASADRFLQTDPRFRIPSAAAIEVEGNTNVRRSEMLAVFADDMQRNIFHVPLGVRRAQVEQIAWVDHATVMRLLPNRLRIHVVERTPVAFTRQGNTIGMVDASGVLLTMPQDAAGNPRYSFPVVTGFNAQDTAKERAERMGLYTSFVHDLDSGGEKISRDLSEVDLSDMEDVKALIPDHSDEVLVHFGSDDFLNRYHRFREHIDEWRGQYPHLSSVDMRYTQQVVLRSNEASAATAAGGKVITQAAASSGAAVAGGAAETAQRGAATPAHLSESSAAASHAAQAGHPVARPLTHTAASLPSRPAPTAAHARPTHSAETNRKVEAIKAWMARRDQARRSAAAGKAQTSAAR